MTALLVQDLHHEQDALTCADLRREERLLSLADLLRDQIHSLSAARGALATLYSLGRLRYALDACARILRNTFVTAGGSPVISEELEDLLSELQFVCQNHATDWPRYAPSNSWDLGSCDSDSIPVIVFVSCLHAAACGGVLWMQKLWSPASVQNPELTYALPLKPGVRQNIAMHA